MKASQILLALLWLGFPFLAGCGANPALPAAAPSRLAADRRALPPRSAPAPAQQLCHKKNPDDCF
jgi:hypothetical protein